MEIAADVAKGAKRAFREVRDAPAAPLSEVHYTKTSNVKNVAWPKRGRCIIPLPAGHDFTENLPVSFQGQDATVLQSHASYVVLDKRNRVRTITQHCVTVDTSAMRAKTRDAWAPFFQRDPANFEHPQWNDAAALLNEIPDCPQFDVPDICVADVRRAIHHTAIASGRGVCGFSTLDIRRQPHHNLYMFTVPLKRVMIGHASGLSPGPCA